MPFMIIRENHPATRNYGWDQFVIRIPERSGSAEDAIKTYKLHQGRKLFFGIEDYVGNGRLYVKAFT